MIRNLPPLAQSYQSALRKHLAEGEAVDLTAAQELGERAVRLGIGTLELAKIHEEALLSILLPRRKDPDGARMIRRCVSFFSEAATPLETTHQNANEASHHLKANLETLTQRTLELATFNQKLNSEIAHAQAIEETLRISEQNRSLLLKKSCQLQEELRHLTRQLLSAQEEERRRISKDLHDIITQTLTGINLRLVALKTRTEASSRELRQKIGVTQRLVEKSVNIVHRFARELRPALLDDVGLIPALKALLDGFMKKEGKRASLIVYAGVENLPGEIRTVLYRVVQEALKNVGRHSHASQVTVRIQEVAGNVCMEIHDNGCGFAIEEVRQRLGIKGLGLLGMRERVEMVGGTFAVHSAPGQETTLRIEIPSDAPKEGKTASSRTAQQHTKPKPSKPRALTRPHTS